MQLTRRATCHEQVLAGAHMFQTGPVHLHFALVLVRGEQPVPYLPDLLHLPARAVEERTRVVISGFSQFSPQCGTEPVVTLL